MNFNTEHPAIIAINDFLMFENLVFLPMILGSSQIRVTHDIESNSLVIDGYAGKTTFHGVNGIELTGYVSENIFKNNIENTFNHISWLEHRYHDNLDSEEFQNQIAPLKNKLPAMYEKINNRYWVINHSENEDALTMALSFISTYNPFRFDYKKIITEKMQETQQAD